MARQDPGGEGASQRLLWRQVRSLFSAPYVGKETTKRPKYRRLVLEVAGADGFEGVLSPSQAKALAPPTMNKPQKKKPPKHAWYPSSLWYPSSTWSPTRDWWPGSDWFPTNE